MNQPKYTTVLTLNDYKSFIEENLTDNIADFKEIFRNEGVIIFSGKAVYQNSKVLAYFGNFSCRILKWQPSEMNQIDGSAPMIITTPYVKFLSKKLEIASQFNSVWGAYRDELISEHNARVESKRAFIIKQVEEEHAHKVEQAEQEYCENLLIK